MAQANDSHLEGQEELRRLVGRNAEAIASLRARVHQRTSWHARLIATLSRHIGRPAMLYGTAFLVLAWMALNALLPHLGHQAFDPAPFFWLQGGVGLAALLSSLMVLIGQNRQAQIAEHRAELDLQVNLLAEQRTAKLIGLVEELRRDLPNVRNRGDRHADALTHIADPTVVATVVEQALENVERKQGGEPGLMDLDGTGDGGEPQG